ncbi:DUF3025 domain-containing protein [Piscinibacter sakaiensis]|uniref:DUF3025 domain-containing protein n=1 Tax=Piscinibacter sakaiensis TaxID=1547922 RepID=UPI00372AD4DD
MAWTAGATPARPRGYEAWIAAERAVPTRDDLHDLFNGLVWLAFPALKWALNRRQASEIAGRGVGPRRGAWRDALTLFDELDVAMAPPRHRPLPVLGVPGWWPANADPAFYDDPAVFRPAPARRAIIAA